MSPRGPTAGRITTPTPTGLINNSNIDEGISGSDRLSFLQKMRRFEESLSPTPPSASTRPPPPPPSLRNNNQNNMSSIDSTSSPYYDGQSGRPSLDQQFSNSKSSSTRVLAWTNSGTANSTHSQYGNSSRENMEQRQQQSSSPTPRSYQQQQQLRQSVDFLSNLDDMDFFEAKAKLEDELKVLLNNKASVSSFKLPESLLGRNNVCT